MAMKTSNEKFGERVDKGIQDAFMRGAVSSAQERFQSRRLSAAEELGNWEEWRSHGEEIRQHVLENIDYYLYELSESVSKRGGHVFLQKQQKKPLNIFRTS